MLSQMAFAGTMWAPGHIIMAEVSDYSGMFQLLQPRDESLLLRRATEKGLCEASILVKETQKR